MKRIALLGVLCAVALSCVPAAASAWKHPTNLQRTEILEAAELHEAACWEVEFNTHSSCEYFIRISTKGPWAAEYVHPAKGHEDEWQGGIASFKRVAGEWRFRSLAQDAQGCGAPKAVRRDLHIYCW